MVQERRTPCCTDARFAWIQVFHLVERPGDGQGALSLDFYDSREWVMGGNAHHRQGRTLCTFERVCIGGKATRSSPQTQPKKVCDYKKFGISKEKESVGHSDDLPHNAY